MILPSRPDPPEDPRKTFPSPKRPCPNCGDETPRHQRPSYREQFAKYLDRIDYWCPECHAHVGTKTSYYGPEPTYGNRRI